MCFYNNNLYEAGDFFEIGKGSTETYSVKNIAEYYKGNWIPLGGVSGAGYTGYTPVSAMIVYNSKLIIGSNTGPISEWNDTVLSEMPNDGIMSSTTIYCFCIYNDSLFAGTYNGLYEFNGNKWFATGITGTVYALTSYNGLLYIGGSMLEQFSQTSSTNEKAICSWQGMGTNLCNLGQPDLTLTGSPCVGGGSTIYTLAIYNGNLICGGAINGGINYDGTVVPSNNIIQWNISPPTSVNQVIDGNILVYPNPASDILNITGAIEGTLKLYDVSGRLLVEEKIKGNTQLNLSSYDTGVYLLQVITDNTVITKRVEKL